MTLIERLEAGKPEEQEALLKEMFAVASLPLSDWASQKEDGRWLYRKVLFNDRLDCGAYLDAVMLLVPVNHEWSVSWAGNSCAEIAELPDGPSHHGQGETPAMALAAAILKAKEVQP